MSLGELGHATVRVTADLNPMTAGLRMARGQVTTFVSGATAVLLAGSAGIAGVAVGAVRALRGAFNASADLRESLDLAGNVFGGSSSVITKTADDMAARLGVVKREFVDGAIQAGTLAKGLGGLDSSKAAEAGTAIAKLAADLASAKNVRFEEAMRAITAGLAGETEPLRRFGVNLLQTEVQAEALRMGLVRTSKEVGNLTKEQKYQATSSLIFRGLGDVQGDLERTINSPKNRMRALQGRGLNLMADVGEAITPAATEVLGHFERIAAVIGETFQRNREAIRSFAEFVAGDLRAVSDAMFGVAGAAAALATGAGMADWAAGVAAGVGAVRDTIREAVGVIGMAYRNWATMQEIVGVTVQTYGENIAAIFRWIGESARALLTWVGENWRAAFVDAFTAVLTAGTNFGENIQNLFAAVRRVLSDPLNAKFDFQWKPLTEGFEATVAQLPDIAAPHLKKVEDQVGGAVAAMTDRELKRQADAAAAGGDAAARAKVAPMRAGAGAEGGPAEATGKEKRAATVYSSPSDLAKAAVTAALSGHGDVQRDQLAELRGIHQALVGGDRGPGPAAGPGVVGGAIGRRLAPLGARAEAAAAVGRRAAANRRAKEARMAAIRAARARRLATVHAGARGLRPGLPPAAARAAGIAGALAPLAGPGALGLLAGALGGLDRPRAGEARLLTETQGQTKILGDISKKLDVPRPAVLR
jgi:hypothetical protein